MKPPPRSPGSLPPEGARSGPGDPDPEPQPPRSLGSLPPEGAEPGPHEVPADLVEPGEGPDRPRSDAACKVCQWLRTAGRH